MVRGSSFSWKRWLTIFTLLIAFPVSSVAAYDGVADDSEPAQSLSDNLPANDDSPTEGKQPDDGQVEYSQGAASCSESVNIDWQECCSECCPLWSVKAGTVILTRELPRATPLLQNTVNSATLLNANAFDFNWAAGLDMTLTREFGNGDGIDVRYFGVDGFSAQQTITTSPIWNFPTNPPLFGLGVANVDAIYASRLYSTEVNWRREANEWLTVLAGFRWIEFHERLAFNADFGGNQALISENTANHLYGGQIGLDGRIWHYNRLTVDAYTKAGIYFNSADQDFSVTQAIGPAFGAGQRMDTAAFAGELGANGNYWITDRLALRAGYQMLWLQSVAVASDQIANVDVLNATGISVGGSVFYHGATAGIEYLW